MTAQPEELAGGWGQDVPPVRMGDTVHRQIGENGKFVHEVLTFLEDAQFDWAPRYLGVDDEGREIVQYIEGYTPRGQDVPKETWSLETMTEIFEKIRELHDLTSGSDLAGEEECVNHGDLSYANTIYRDGRAVTFIDWDWAHGGKRVDDVAAALLQYLSIGEYKSEAGPSERAELARKLVDAYGFTSEQRKGLTDVMLDSLMKTRDHQLGLISKGNPAGMRLAKAKIPEQMLKRHTWLKQNRADFDASFAS